MAIPASIKDYLRSRNVPFDVVVHPMAYTAQQEAALAHVPGREWAKTVVCFADDAPVLAVLPAHYAVDLEDLRALAGAAHMRLATEAEVARLYPGCETGAMPPLGPLYGQRVFIEQALAEDVNVVFNAGTHVDAVRMRYDALASLTGAVVGRFGHVRRQVAGWREDY
ncbi:MAG: aminoacyl-tRNA deacylase [Bacteroidales bacterium]